MNANRNTDINGLLACPKCNALGKVRLQTPPDEDDIVRRAYFRCFKCNCLSDNFPNWEPVHWRESGSVAWAPLRDHWNHWVEAQP